MYIHYLVIVQVMASHVRGISLSEQTIKHYSRILSSVYLQILPESLVTHKRQRMLFRVSLWYSPSKPLELNLWATNGSGSQQWRQRVWVRSHCGSHVMWRSLIAPHWRLPVCRNPMKATTAVLSATLLIVRLLNQQNLALVRVHVLIACVYRITPTVCFLFADSCIWYQYCITDVNPQSIRVKIISFSFLLLSL